MLSPEDIKAIERTESLLALLKNEGDSIFKIIGLVQDNGTWFDCRVGHSCLKSAADKLEQLIKESNDNGKQP
jgi:uncharacterized protein YlaN (UPF0358 family)